MVGGWIGECADVADVVMLVGSGVRVRVVGRRVLVVAAGVSGLVKGYRVGGVCCGWVPCRGRHR